MFQKHIVFGFLFLFVFTNSQADHLAAAEITYVSLGGNTYRVTLHIYRDCSGSAMAAGNINLRVASASCAQNFGVQLVQQPPGPVDVAPVCPTSSTSCTGGSEPGMHEMLYQADVTLPLVCSDWVFSISLPARTDHTNLVNSGVQAMVVSTGVNNSLAVPNNSPTFSTKPLLFLCANQAVCYSQGAIDVDGDSLTFAFTTPKYGGAAVTNYVPPHTANDPFGPASGITLDAVTGDMCMTPPAPGTFAIAIQVREYRNGVLINTMVRDMEAIVANCINDVPDLSGVNGTPTSTATFPVGVNSCFIINSSDADAGQIVSMSWNSAIPGATFTTSAAANPVGTFCWTPTAADACRGSYLFTVKVQDNACGLNAINYKTFKVSIPLDVNSSPNSTICYGANTNLLATNGFNYNWTPVTGLSDPTIANPVASPLTTTKYYVTTSCPNGKTNTDSTTITVTPQIIPDAGADVTICNGDNTTLNGSGGGTYSWNPVTGLSDPLIANPVASPSATTTYTLTVTDAFSCFKTDDITVFVGSAVVANAGRDTMICRGTGVSLAASGGSSYSWSPITGLSDPTVANPVANPSVTTVYTVQVGSGSCTPSTDNLTVTVNDMPIPYAGRDTFLCSGVSTPLIASGGTEYSWSPVEGLTCTDCPNPVAMPSNTTEYTVSIKKGSCGPLSDKVLVRINTPVIANAGKDSAICNGNVVNMTGIASGGRPGSGYNYQWTSIPAGTNGSTSSISVSPTQNTQFVLKITDSLLCIDEDTMSIIVDQPVASPLISCGDATLTEVTFNWNRIANANGYEISTDGGTTWSTPSSGATINDTSHTERNLNPNTAVSILVRALNDNLCGNSTNSSFSCSSNLCPSIKIILTASENPVEQGGTIELKAEITGGIGPFEYTWIPSIGNSVGPYKLFPTENTQYIVNLRDAGALPCPDVSDTLQVIITNKRFDFTFPNIFSPNGDFINEVFSPVGDVPKSYLLQIYNRWGERVFISNNFNIPWNGSFGNDKANLCSDGVYVYLADVIDQNGEAHNFKGLVTLIR